MFAQYRQRVRDYILESVVEREMKEVMFHRSSTLEDVESRIDSDKLTYALYIANDGFEILPLIIEDVMTIKNAEAWRVRGTSDEATRG